jgi:hypothetical protein
VGGVVPGDDARPHRGADFAQGGSSPRLEGERHDGPPDPAGTGFEYYRNVRIPADEPPPPPPSPEELDEMEYFVEPKEAFTRDEIE